MSQFSEKLKILVEDSGITIYQLAKSAEIDRTTIQRAITGERLPGILFVEKLCDYLRVSPAERDDLLSYYSICKIGEKVYAGRKYIEGIIEQIAGLHIYQGDLPAIKRVVSGNDISKQETRVFVGQYGINKLVRDVLEEEICNGETLSVNLSIPFSFSALFDYLRQLYWESNGTLSIQHVIKFDKNPHVKQNPNINLEVLSNALPFAFCMGNGYQPRYYYAGLSDADMFSYAMPFYFYTQKRLVVLSADFKTAILYNNQSVLQVYQEHFRSCFAQSFPLVQQLSAPLDMLAVGFGDALETNQVSHVIEPQPCFAKYYTDDMIERYIRPEVPEQEKIKASVLKLYACYRSFEHPLKSFFTVSGLWTLAEKGIMADLPQSVVFPFEIADRLYLLESLRASIQDDTYFVRAIDTSKIQISHMATIQIYNNQSLLFMAISDKGIVCSMIFEQSICDAFFDFFESLPENKLLYSKTDTLKVLDECIAYLKQLENAD